MECEVFVFWVAEIPVVSCDFLVILVVMPGAFNMMAPNVLALSIGVIGNFMWCLFKIENF